MVSDQSGSRTQVSLILRAQNLDDQAAWSEFVHRYGPRIITWCHRWSRQHADAEDLSQDILLRVWIKLPALRYEAKGTFRGWLWTVSRNAFVDTLRSKNVMVAHDRVICETLEEQSLALARDIEQQFDEETLHLACVEVRQVVGAVQWQIFEQTELRGNDAGEVARSFHKSIAAVRMNNLRIRKQIRAKIMQIEESLNLSRS